MGPNTLFTPLIDATGCLPPTPPPPTVTVYEPGEVDTGNAEPA